MRIVSDARPRSAALAFGGNHTARTQEAITMQQVETVIIGAPA